MTEPEWRHFTPKGIHLGDDRSTPSLAGWWRRFMREAKAHHQALRAFTSSRFRATYRAQSLGIVWPIANPLVLMLVISVVFGVVFKGEVQAYPVFLMLGLVLWQFLTHSWTQATGSLVSHADIVKRAAVPAWVVLVGTVLSHVFTLGFASLSLLPLVAVYPEAFHVTFGLLLVPFNVAAVVLTAIALSLATGVLNAAYRDVGYIVDSVLLVVFWATPIMWPLEYVPQWFRPFVLVNPIASNLQCIRDVVLKGAWPPGTVIAAAFVGPLLLLAAGAFVYDRRAASVPDHV